MLTVPKKECLQQFLKKFRREKNIVLYVETLHATSQHNYYKIKTSIRRLHATSLQNIFISDFKI